MEFLYSFVIKVFVQKITFFECCASNLEMEQGYNGIH